MEWFRTNIPGPIIFLIVSDDVKWCSKYLLNSNSNDVAIVSKSPAHDLALLATSYHAIIDYGTYGVWGAFMAGGHTISLNTDKHFNEVMANFTNKWHVFEHKDFARNS
jgi:galactoside 2-L-fucosyltransferase 1/2